MEKHHSEIPIINKTPAQARADAEAAAVAEEQVEQPEEQVEQPEEQVEQPAPPPKAKSKKAKK